MQTWECACLIGYSAVVGLLSLYGLHRYHLLRLYRRHRDEAVLPLARFVELPRVTVQLPLYNEYHVAERLLEAVAAIDYPRDRLQVQVLDDSEDETQEVARATVARLAASGLDVEYLHRQEREGFKAGALHAGLSRASGELILILDADFVPQPEVLLQAVHYFTDPRVGMVQMRWEHLNRRYSLLTRVQAILLDGHFVVEHTARSRSGRFFNFNGTAGIWRRQAIAAAGGWQHDTLTEDLDLSYRAQLAGWVFVFLPDVAVPGELPVDINAFKCQQQRWTKGAVQTARKLLPRIWRSSHPLRVKVEASFHLTTNACYVLMLLMALLTLPVVTVRSHLGWERLLLIDLPLFSCATLTMCAYYAASQRAVLPDWRGQLKYLPLLMAVGLSLCLNNTRAVVEGCLGHRSPFERTPKHGVTGGDRHRRRPWRYRGRRGALTLGELAMAAYFWRALDSAWSAGLYAGIPFLLLFLAGFLYTGTVSVVQPWLQPRAGRRAALQPGC
ncbi:MAG: glycosyltransferase [Candidatus Latescibacterota bacterium]